MLVYVLGDILLILLILFIILYMLISVVLYEIRKIGKKNCYKCKYYRLHDVASVGDHCWYKCTKNNRVDEGCSLNNNEHFEKCKYFTNKGE